VPNGTYNCVVGN